VGTDSKIGWTRHTFNGVWGCTKVADGCTYCYAEGEAKRRGNDVWGPKKMRRFIKSGFSDAPLWNHDAKEAGEYHRVFAYSMGDVFEEPIPCCNHKGQPLGFNTDKVRKDLWRLIEHTPNLQWLLLTKRPGDIDKRIPEAWSNHGAPANVMFGTSISSPKDLHYVHKLKANTPPGSRLFCSVEPMIEKFSSNTFGQVMTDGVKQMDWIEWWILGGESGPKARYCNPEWFLPFLRPSSWHKDMPLPGINKPWPKVFVKQTGSVYARANGLTGKGEDPTEWPEWMRVQETPEGPRW